MSVPATNSYTASDLTAYDLFMEEEWHYEQYREERLVAEERPLSIEEWRESNRPSPCATHGEGPK